MKRLLTIILLFTCFWSLEAQDATPVDTTIYQFVEVSARFPGCERLDTTDQVKATCSQSILMAFLYQNINYPLEARQNGNEGTVVVRFVVEPDGSISNEEILKDIGGGCGDEALRIIKAMNEINLKWRPAFNKGKAVRSWVNVPVKFKLEEPPNFSLIDGDTVYVVFDDTLKYKGGTDALMKHFKENLTYPKMYEDSCWIGKMSATIIVPPNGRVKVLEVSDYSGLGFDFQWESIVACSNTTGNWEFATFEGREVTAAYDVSFNFTPPGATCANVVTSFEKATNLSIEGSDLFNAGEKEAGLAKITEAVKLFPNNAEFLYIRGQMYMDLEQMDKACEDFTQVSKTVTIPLVNNLSTLICQDQTE